MDGNTNGGVEQATYPEVELSKYELKNQPENNVNSDSRIGGGTGIAKPGGYVMKIKRKTKQKVTKSSNTTSLLRRHISERSWTLRNWYRHIHWKNFTVTVLVPLVGLCLSILLQPKLVKNTAYFMVGSYIVTVICINLLYHRYWSHHSFDFTNESLVKILTIICSGGGITSARNWCSSHRAHHRYCDVTDTDPHNIRRGLFFSHMGWMILIHHPKVAKAIKESKLDEFPNEQIVQWQLQYYMTLFVTVGLVLPSMVCGYFWEDYVGGLIYGGFVKLVLVQHSIFAVNSVGHTLGSRPYNNRKSPRNNYLLSCVTMGEGNQNFHHEFPMDYRNGYELYNFDPTKWTVQLLQFFSQVENVKVANQSTIEKSLIQQQQQLLDDIRSQLNWGIPIEKLPVFTPEEFRKLASGSRDRYLVVVSGIIHDVTPFSLDHPGGLPLIKASHGKDATTAFNGAVYQHSNAAKNLLATMRIGKLGGSESLYWKQQRMENKSVPIDNDSEGKRIVRCGEQATSFGRLGSTAGAA